MLIINTIIRNGISRGIPEGTKVPEKPKYCLSFGKTNCEELATRIGKFCACKIMEEKYNANLQALWDASPEWGDQEAVKKILPFEAMKKDGYKWITKDGIYPLEGVNAIVQELCHRGSCVHGDGGCYAEGMAGETCQAKKFLRLIPQPNSEQKNISSSQRKGEIDREREEVEVTEVSEPSQNVVFDLVKHPPKAAPAVKFKMGVDEKKKPDYDRDQFLNERDDRGVSEGEPNQDVNAVLEELHTMFVEGKTHKEILSKFHIQKLKP